MYYGISQEDKDKINKCLEEPWGHNWSIVINKVCGEILEPKCFFGQATDTTIFFTLLSNYKKWDDKKLLQVLKILNLEKEFHAANNAALNGNLKNELLEK